LQQILWQNIYTPAHIALAFRNGMGYRYLNVCINSVNDASILCKNLVNYGPVTPEKTALICELLYDMAKNVFSRISNDILDRFLRCFHHMKARRVQMIELYLVFRFFKGRCHGNQLILGKCHERRLIPLAFFALSLENELQYHCLNVRINSGDDVATSYKKWVNFCR